jgi:tRNA pseudouridine38-40 synthase
MQQAAVLVALSAACHLLVSKVAMLRNIKLILEYDGTNYHGWQAQAGSGTPTVQEALEKALAELVGEPVRTTSSGRTDAGVHALGHAANFLTSSAIPAENFAKALNRHLPADIRALRAEDVPPGFHARYCASGKTYQYRILNRTMPSALLRGRAWHVDRKLNAAAMRRAAAALIGRHDFSAFRSASCGASSPVRTLRDISIHKRGDILEITLTADAFLMHMARNICGTLVEAGLGRFTTEEVKRILRSRDRSRAGRTAPACGLYLLEVSYPRTFPRSGPCRRTKRNP